MFGNNKLLHFLVIWHVPQDIKMEFRQSVIWLGLLPFPPPTGPSLAACGGGKREMDGWMEGGRDGWMIDRYKKIEKKTPK